MSRTIIIYYLGSAYLGLGGVFNSIVNILNISELGFASALSFILYKPIAESDSERVRKGFEEEYEELYPRPELKFVTAEDIALELGGKTNEMGE